MTPGGVAGPPWPEEWRGLGTRAIRAGGYPCTAPGHMGHGRAAGRSPSAGLPVCSRCYGIERYGFCHCGRGAQTPAGLCKVHHLGTCACGTRASCRRDGVAVCTACKYGTCACGARAGNLLNGVPVCMACKYGTCACGTRASCILDGVQVCTACRYGTCACGKRVTGLRDGVPVCMACKYGTCACGNLAKSLRDGVPVCTGCYYGTCTIEGCQSAAVGGRLAGQPVCVRHFVGTCRAPRCTAGVSTYMPNTKIGVCKVHRRHGLDYVAKAGHRDDDPGDIYVVHHHELGLVKVGIGKNSARVADHTADGWTKVINQSMPTTREARAFETAALRDWRRAGVGVLGRQGARELGLKSVGRGTEVTDGTYAYAVELAEWVRQGDPGAPVPIPEGYRVPERATA